MPFILAIASQTPNKKRVPKNSRNIPNVCPSILARRSDVGTHSYGMYLLLPPTH